MKYLGAVGEKRRATLTQIETARIELREQRDQMRRRFPLACGETRHFGEQFAVP